MSKYNKTTTRPTAKPVTTTTGSAVNHAGGVGFTADTKSELLRLAVSNYGTEETFYDDAESRDSRYRSLVRAAAVADPQWTADMLAWLRSEANMRSASVVGAAEYVLAHREAGMTGWARGVVASVLQRADEPGEIVGYWHGRYGRTLPQPLLKGVRDAMRRLYVPYATKWDRPGGLRFVDLLNLLHPKPVDQEQARFWGALTDASTASQVKMLAARQRLQDLPQEDRRALLEGPDAAERLREAGMTWEMLGGWLQGSVGAAAWEAIAPSMGYMALLRNLRNFDEAGMSEAAAKRVAAVICDPERVAASRQLPYRFLSAYRAAPSDRWRQPLEEALGHSLKNVPALPGRTLVLVDTSASMDCAYSARATVTAAEVAVLLGVSFAVGQRGGADLYGFATGVFRHDVPSGASVLRTVEAFNARLGEVGHGTELRAALRATYAGHDRVLIVSDMQCVAGGALAVPDRVHVYGVNVVGYETSAIDTGRANQHELTGAGDAALRQMQALEAGQDGVWPWQASE